MGFPPQMCKTAVAQSKQQTIEEAMDIIDKL
jgi:hypothetical protein